jgi:hypothetical protein
VSVATAAGKFFVSVTMSQENDSDVTPVAQFSSLHPQRAAIAARFLARQLTNKQELKGFGERMAATTIL